MTFRSLKDQTWLWPVFIFTIISFNGCIDGDVIYVHLWCGVNPNSAMYASIVEEIKLEILNKISRRVSVKITWPYIMNLWLVRLYAIMIK